jgi:quinol monooxygenase YgiN
MPRNVPYLFDWRKSRQDANLPAPKPETTRERTMAADDGVTITFEFRLKPEALEPFLQGAPMMFQGTAEAPGFRSIRVVQNKDDPACIMFIERWDSEDAYRKYIAWRTERGEMDAFGQAVVSAETKVWPRLVIEA